MAGLVLVWHPEACRALASIAFNLDVRAKDTYGKVREVLTQMHVAAAVMSNTEYLLAGRGPALQVKLIGTPGHPLGHSRPKPTISFKYYSTSPPFQYSKNVMVGKKMTTLLQF